MYETKILSKRNPQLANNLGLALNENYLERGYEDLFGGRASRYSRSDSVASMFSPAGYLTEMYREARELHYDSSIFNLNKRRPDLADLVLNQDNMDQEASTLELSNEILLALYNQKFGGELPLVSIYQLLAQHVTSGETPYNHYYETLHNCITVRDPELTQLSEYRELYNLGNTESFLGVVSHISPELYQILTEPLTEATIDILYRRYFGDTPEGYITSADGLRQYYGLTNDEVRLFIGDSGFIDTYNDGDYVNDQLVRLIYDEQGGAEIIRLTRDRSPYVNQINFVSLYPITRDIHRVEVSFRDNNGASIKVLVDGIEVASVKESVVAGKVYTFEIPIAGLTSRKNVDIRFIRSYLIGSAHYEAGARFAIEEFYTRDFILRLNKAIRLYKVTGLAPEILTRIFADETGHYAIDDNNMRRLFYTLIYQQRHRLAATDAVVIAGVNFNRNLEMGEMISQFDRLFNNPPLNGRYFEPDDKSLNLNATDAGSIFKINALKRAFNLDHAELKQLVYLFNKNDRINIYLDRLSALYRLKSFADLNGLTVYELAHLFNFIPMRTTPNGFTESEWHSLGEYIYDLMQWLKKHQITPVQLSLMLINSYDGTYTPEIAGFLSSVRAGTANLASTQYSDYAALANTFAAALGLSSESAAQSLLKWLDDVKANNDLATHDLIA